MYHHPSGIIYCELKLGDILGRDCNHRRIEEMLVECLSEDNCVKRNHNICTGEFGACESQGETVESIVKTAKEVVNSTKVNFESPVKIEFNIRRSLLEDVTSIVNSADMFTREYVLNDLIMEGLTRYRENKIIYKCPFCNTVKLAHRIHKDGSIDCDNCNSLIQEV